MHKFIDYPQDVMLTAFKNQIEKNNDVGKWKQNNIK